MQIRVRVPRHMEAPPLTEDAWDSRLGSLDSECPGLLSGLRGTGDSAVSPKRLVGERLVRSIPAAPTGRAVACPVAVFAPPPFCSVLGFSEGSGLDGDPARHLLQLALPSHCPLFSLTEPAGMAT